MAESHEARLESSCSTAVYFKSYARKVATMVVELTCSIRMTHDPRLASLDLDPKSVPGSREPASVVQAQKFKHQSPTPDPADHHHTEYRLEGYPGRLEI
jgi:hypothetical protein